MDSMEPFNFAAFADDKTAWSIATFGPGKRTAGVIDHIRKELAEVEARPDDVSEWADLIILAMDGAARSAGADGAKLVEALVAKMARNKARTWPDWRTLSEDRAIEHDRSGEPSVPDLLARIDADAIVARIDNAIACTIRPSELEAVRAIVCDAVTAGQDAGIEIARLQREHRARHAVEQVDGSAMLRELGADPERWADACAAILGDPGAAASDALLGWFSNAMAVAGDHARRERLRLGPTAVRYASGLEDGELADAVANGIVRYLEDGTAAVVTPQGTVTARSGDWIVRDYQHHYYVAVQPASDGTERPLNADVLLPLGTDASKWATAFMEKWATAFMDALMESPEPGDGDLTKWMAAQEALTHAWFANAIKIGLDAGVRQERDRARSEPAIAGATTRGQIEDNLTGALDGFADAMIAMATTDAVDWPTVESRLRAAVADALDLIHTQSARIADGRVPVKLHAASGPAIDFDPLAAVLADDKPLGEAVLRLFRYSHLPAGLAAVSRPFAELAVATVEKTPPSDERTLTLRALWEAKNLAVVAVGFVAGRPPGVPTAAR